MRRVEARLGVLAVGVADFTQKSSDNERRMMAFIPAQCLIPLPE